MVRETFGYLSSGCESVKPKEACGASGRGVDIDSQNLATDMAVDFWGKRAKNFGGKLLWVVQMKYSSGKKSGHGPTLDCISQLRYTVLLRESPCGMEEYDERSDINATRSG
jgi:hypothetical protein